MLNMYYQFYSASDSGRICRNFINFPPPFSSHFMKIAGFLGQTEVCGSCFIVEDKIKEGSLELGRIRRRKVFKLV